jgi:CHASE3 domain sensor protein
MGTLAAFILGGMVIAFLWAFRESNRELGPVNAELLESIVNEDDREKRRATARQYVFVRATGLGLLALYAAIGAVGGLIAWAIWRFA